jgi:hypothetical protein
MEKKRCPEILNEFRIWMMDVDAAMLNICGLSSDDLADACYRDMFDDEVSPQEAAETVLEDEGFEF